MGNIRIMRLTWNTNNWEFPSAHYWRKENQGNSSIAYENQYGFGGEEWLFNSRYKIDKFQYGYIRGVDKLSGDIEQLEKVYLYTINPDTKQRFIVGSIKNVQIIEGWKEEIDKVRPHYKNSLTEAAEELKAVNADYVFFKKQKHEMLPNVKFNIDDTEIYTIPIESSYLNKPSFYRFMPYKVDAKIEKELFKGTQTKNTFVFTSGKAAATKSYKKKTTGKESTVNSVHTSITEDLYKYLQKKGVKKSEISVELTRVGTSIVDVAVKKDSSFSLYEVKTSNIGLQNIRQAIGQLFEYAFLDKTVKLDEMVIIAPVKLKKQEKEYLETLNKHLKIKVQYWAYLKEEKKLENRFIRQ
jgi:hypothetical protein